MNKSLIIADDLTGGADAGAQFAKRSMKTLLVPYRGEGSVPLFAHPAQDVLVINTITRGLPPAEAFDILSGLLKSFDPKRFPILYKKIDSTLRGNIGAEIDAILAETALPLCFMAPSYPEQGRVLVGGIMMVREKPLALTEAARDAASPVQESHVCKLLANQTSLSIGTIDLTHVASGKAAVGSGATSNPKLAGARVLVADPQANLAFLRAGRGSHNIEYALKIVRVGFEQVTVAFRMAGVTGGPPKPAILASPSAYCATLCHTRVMPSDKVFFREMELQFPHALHVKDVGLECAKCHSPEKHKMRIVTKSECMKCHHESKDIDCGHCHKAQQALYEGKVKAYGVTPAPDVMAAGKTKCIECHDLKKGTQTVLTVKAKCEGCHDAKYGKMLLDWKQAITKQENAIAVALEEAKEYVVRTKKAGRDVSKEETLVRQADANYQAVSAGRGVHNYKLSREMLRAAQADLDKVLAAKRKK